MRTAVVGHVCVVLAVLSGGVVGAQQITGNLRGTVYDPSGAVLPGATVVLTSPALLRGPSSSETDDKGQFLFLALQPGLYRLEVRASGFDPYFETDLRAQVGGTLELRVTLGLESLVESVTVSGGEPLVDARAVGLGNNYDAVAIRDLPIPRFSTYDLVKSAPGVSAVSPSTRQRNLSVLGAGINESTYLLDGTDVTSPRYGTARVSPATDALEEVEILLFGAPAEYGNLQGGVLNIVTRQGGDDFRADASYYGQWSALTQKPVVEACNCPAGESGFERALYRDFSANGGGPIVKDRAWFFGAYQIQWDFSSLPGADPAFPSENKLSAGSGKLNWQVSPALNLMSSFHYDAWSQPDRVPNAFVPYETTSVRAGHGLAATIAQLTYAHGPDSLYELRASTASFTSGLTPVNGSKSLPARLDLAIGGFSGGALYFGDTLERKSDVRAKLSHYAADFLASDHDFAFGTQFATAGSEGYYGYPGAAHYLDYEGEPFIARYRDTYSYGGSFKSLGIFAEDTVRVGERLTLDLGVRFDYSRARSPNVSERGTLGDETGRTVEGRGFLYDWSVVSPRLGVNYMLTSDGRTSLRVFYGRFHPGMLTTELQTVSPGFGPIRQAFYDPNAGEYATASSVIDPLSNVAIDPDTRSPHTDQVAIGIERGIGRDWSLEASFVRRTGSDFTGWRDVGGSYGRETIALADGTPLEVYPLRNRPEDRFFVLSNREDYFIRHHAFLFTAQKRFRQGWQLLFSYGWSRARGLQSQNGQEDLGMQGSLTTSFNAFGRDPNDLTNATGILPTDRTHTLRVQGSVEIPKARVLVGFSFQHVTGRPYTAVTNVTLPQGVRSVFIEPLGSRRLSSQELLDLRLSKAFQVGPRARVEILLDVLNALGDTAEEGVATRNYFSPNFAVSSDFVPPRRAMVGARLSF